MIRLTLYIRTDLDPGVLYHRIEDRLQNVPNSLTIVAGSAERIEEPENPELFCGHGVPLSISCVKCYGVVVHPEDARIDQ